jgi:integrase
MFQFQTGVRIGELCAIRYEDLFDTEIFVNRMYRYETKEVVPYNKGHSAGRYVTLTSEAKRLIEAAKVYQRSHGLSDSGYIFSVDDNPLSYYAVRKAYGRYCDAVGCLNKSSHKARKTYISALIDGGVNINEIRELVGHADERTTYNSYCFDRTPKKERAQLIEAALKQ